MHVVDAAERGVRTSRAVARLLFGRDIAHILLLHVGAFDAVMLRTILGDLRAKGVTFVTLDEATADPAYAISPNYTGEVGLTFLEQVAAVRHVDLSKLEETPYTLARLGALCSAK